MEQNEIAVMKSAATRLQAFLATKNIEVGHAIALEALSASLGSRNWRTLRDKLSAPTVPPLPPAPFSPGVSGPKWLVEGRYYDGSPYGDYFGGETPLEAKIGALYYRMMEDGKSSFAVHKVIDRETNEDVDEQIMTMSDLQKHGALFIDILGLVRGLLMFRSLHEIEGEDHDILAAARANLAKAFESEKLVNQLNDFPGAVPPVCSIAGNVMGFESEGQLITCDLAEVLRGFAKLLRDEQSRLEDDRLQTLYQFETLLETYEDEIVAILMTFLHVG